MPPLLEDPRIRQNWNQFSSNAETAAENAAASIWTFTHSYISPCLASVSNSVRECSGTCFPERERRQRERGRSHGRAERSFDFYDDWDDDLQNSGTGGGLLGWGNDELDRLLAGSGSYGDDGTTQPGRRRGMSYGTRGGGNRPKRKGTIDGLPDPTIIPSTSAIGFLGRLPFKLGRTLRYKPSAADLKEHPGALKRDLGTEEGEPLIADDEDVIHTHTRKRSSTTGSGDTTDSFRSRGDLFPSDGEDDAVLLDDEFAMVLERRTTNSAGDDRSSSKTKSSKGKRPAGSSNLSRAQSVNTESSKRPSMKRNRRSSTSEVTSSRTNLLEMPSLTDLQQEEDDIRREEEEEIGRKRNAAQLLARQRGLSLSAEATEEVKEEQSTMDQETIEFSPVSSNTLDARNNESSSKPISSSLPKDSDPKPPDKTGSSFVPARLPHF